jgi:transposase
MTKDRIIQSGCKYCGSAVNQNQRGRPSVFCSYACGTAFHNRINNAKQKLPREVSYCRQCGIEFIRAENSKKICCSLKCAHKHTRQGEVFQIRQIAAEQIGQECKISFRDFVLELHSNRYSLMAIAEGLGLSPSTIKHWAERYGRDEDGIWRRIPETRPMQRTKRGAAKAPLYSYESAQTADEWLLKMREVLYLTPDFQHTLSVQTRSIVMVCGVTNIHKGVDSLSTIIQSRLQMNPFDGTVFVFCGKKRDKISYIYWDGIGFDVIRRRQESGTYPWPSPKYGAGIPISSEDFALILYGKRDVSKREYTSFFDWNCFEKIIENP